MLLEQDSQRGLSTASPNIQASDSQRVEPKISYGAKEMSQNGIQTATKTE